MGEKEIVRITLRKDPLTQQAPLEVWGVELASRGDALIVADIAPGGAASCQNRKVRWDHAKIKVGDNIISVNGVRYHARKMCREWNRSRTVHLVIER